MVEMVQVQYLYKVLGATGSKGGECTQSTEKVRTVPGKNCVSNVVFAR